MRSDLNDGTRSVLRAIATYSGLELDEIIELTAGTNRDSLSVGAAADKVVATLNDAIRRVELAPLPFEAKQAVLAELRTLVANPPSTTEATLTAWAKLFRDLPPSIAEIVREPVALPGMPPAQHEAWEVLLDLEEAMKGNWCLVGGQMITLMCAEYGMAIHRPTEDADIVLGVWTTRDALMSASTLLQARGFAEDQTHDGYGYRYKRGHTSIDLLLPENISTQDRVPTTATGRHGIEIPGGNQALIRAERVPVRLDGRVGHVRRPNILGALVGKAAAVQADNRDTDRHRDDIAMLGQIALDQGMFRRMAKMAGPHDRQRLRYAIDSMPAEHSSWRLIKEPEQVRSALVRLSNDTAAI